MDTLELSRIKMNIKGKNKNNKLMPFHLRFTKIYKTTKYLRTKGVFDSIELPMLMRAGYMKERNSLGE